MNDNNNQNKNEMQDAGQNTAHVAGRTASRYFGGELGGRVYDAFSKTNVGQGIERGVGNTISNVPGVGNLNKKLNDSGAVDAANNAINGLTGTNDKLNKTPGNNSNTRGTTKSSSRLPRGNSLGSKSNNEVPDSLKNSGNRNQLNRALYMHHKDSMTSEDKDNLKKNIEDNDPDSKEILDEEDPEDKQKKTTKKILLIKAALFLIVPVLIIALFISLVSSVTEYFAGAFSLFFHKTEESESYLVNSESSSELRDAEIAYNDAIMGSKDGSIKGIIAEYQEKYGVTLDWYLLDATIRYRFINSSYGDVYSDDGSDDIDESEAIERLESFEEKKDETTDTEENSDSSNTDNGSADYSLAKKKIKTVAALMITKSGGTYIADTEVGGNYYNTLIDSKFLKTYYKDMLPDDSYESRKKLVDEIFEFAEAMREAIKGETDTSQGGVVSEIIKVNLQTCEQPYKKTKIDNVEIWDNPSAMGEYGALGIKDYLKGVVYGEIGDHLTEQYKEAIKAQMIAALTFAIKHPESGFSLKNGNMYIPSGNCKQLCCDPINGCTYKKDGEYGTTYSGPKRFSSYIFTRDPMSSEESTLLETILDEIFGYVMVKKGVTASTFEGSSSIPYEAGNYLDSCNPGVCFSQKGSFTDALKGMTYTEILDKYYKNVDSGNGFDLINIKEGLYYTTTGGSGAYNGNLIYYSQGNYSNVTFCGRSGKSIASSGCGVTSAAMIASSFTGDKKYDPKYMMEWAYKLGYCGSGISGTDSGFFPVVARELGLQYQSYNKGQSNEVANALKSGKSLVIAHMGAGHFTGGGHYIVLSSINEQGQVYVNDPNNNKHSGYWDLNLVANEIQSYGYFHVFTKG